MEPDTSALRRGRSLVAPWLWLRRLSLLLAVARTVSQGVGGKENAPLVQRGNQRG